jgi:hypothetical protein
VQRDWCSSRRLGEKRDEVLLDSVAEALVLKSEEIRDPMRAERAPARPA